MFSKWLEWNSSGKQSANANTHIWIWSLAALTTMHSALINKYDCLMLSDCLLLLGGIYFSSFVEHVGNPLLRIYLRLNVWKTETWLKSLSLSLSLRKMEKFIFWKNIIFFYCWLHRRHINEIVKRNVNHFLILM